MFGYIGHTLGLPYFTLKLHIFRQVFFGLETRAKNYSIRSPLPDFVGSTDQGLGRYKVGQYLNGQNQRAPVLYYKIGSIFCHDCQISINLSILTMKQIMLYVNFAKID